LQKTFDIIAENVISRVKPHALCEYSSKQVKSHTGIHAAQ